MFETMRLRGKLRRERMKLDISELEFANRTFADAQKRVEPDPDENLWTKTGEGGDLTPLDQGYDHYEMLTQAFKFWLTDLHARAIVRNLTKFVLGKGPVIKPASENEKAKEWWKTWVRESKWNKKEKEMVSRTFRDGEVFLRFFVDENDGLVKVRFLRANNIKNPSVEKDKVKGENVTSGIGTNPDDVEDVMSYYLCDREGNLRERIDASEVMHLKILVDSDMKRGMSVLLVAMAMIKKYADWVDDRITLNKVRSAVALIRKVPGTSATVGGIRGKHQSEKQSADKYKQKMLNRGTIITASKGIEYDMLSPNIQAADAKDDGRNILLAVAAGVGFPEMILTADYSNANYASSLTAQNPFVREIEDWQDFYEDPYREIYARVIRAGKEYGDLPENTSEECSIEWPPMILADIEKNNKAREIQHRNKIISKKTWQMKEDLDPETEEANMEQEQTKSVYRQPFNLPTSPTNQWGGFYEEGEEE